MGNLPNGQGEAGLAVGLTQGQTLRSVQLPQALVAMLPAMVSQIVVVAEGLGTRIDHRISPNCCEAGQIVSSGDGNPLQVLALVAVVFILVNWVLTAAAHRLSRLLSSRTSGTVAGPGIGNPAAVARPGGGTA